MSKTDMSYYKDLLGRMAGATLGGAAAKTLPPIKGLSGSPVSYTHLTLPTNREV